MKPISTSLTTTKTSTPLATMESLALPAELYWDGKTEPTSPPTSELFSINDLTGNWAYEDNLANEINFINDDPLEIKYNLEFSPELINGEDLVLELCDLKEEHWNDTKQSLSQFLDCSFPISGVIPNPNPIIKVQSPFDINTFGSGSFDNSVLTQLTPPHSPPQNGITPTTFRIAPNNSQSSLNDAALHQTPIPVNVPVPVPVPAAAVASAAVTAALSVPVTQAAPVPLPATPAPATPSVQNFHFANWAASGNQTPAAGGSLIAEVNDDIVRETQIVDEIVSTRAKELLDWNDECESLSSYSAPSQSDSATDEEWTPGSSYSSAGSSPMHISGSGDEQMLQAASVDGATLSSGASTSTSGSPKKRTRAYARGVEDRKIRKKEQNKNAATRYRQKKKLEMEYVLGEEKQLTQRNDELKGTLADCKREAKYLKMLIREFYGKKQ